MSIDIFGRNVGSRATTGPRGPPGPVGPRGPAGLGGLKDMVRWFPILCLKEFRRSESCCFIIADPAKDLVKTIGGYVRWNSNRTECEISADAILPCKLYINISLHKFDPLESNMAKFDPSQVVL